MFDPPPERPSESDCCGTGCVPCVLDVYDEEYSRWKRRQNNVGDQLRRDLLSIVKYRPYEIISVQQLSNDVYMYTFAATPQADGYLPITFTQHVYIQLDEVTRPYTPVSLSTKCSFDVIIKIYPNGQFTQKLLKMKINDKVYVRGPVGGIEYKGYDSIIMFCGGTGLAAFLGLINSILDNDKCDILLQLHYSCKTVENILMRKTLDTFSAYWNCAVYIYLTREQNWSDCSKSFWFNENITKGRITHGIINGIILKQNNLKTSWFICGNDEFNQHILNTLKEYRINENCIHLFQNSSKINKSS